MNQESTQIPEIEIPEPNLKSYFYTDEDIDEFIYHRKDMIGCDLVTKSCLRP